MVRGGCRMSAALKFELLPPAHSSHSICISSVLVEGTWPHFNLNF